MSGLGAALIWLLEVVGKKKIGDLLATGSQKRERIMQRALDESHRDRDRLADVGEILDKTARQRDSYQLEVIRLQLENSALRAELAELRTPPLP